MFFLELEKEKWMSEMETGTLWGMLMMEEEMLYSMVQLPTVSGTEHGEMDVKVVKQAADQGQKRTRGGRGGPIIFLAAGYGEGGGRSGSAGGTGGG